MRKIIGVILLLLVSSIIWAQQQSDVPTIDEQQPIDTLILLEHKGEKVIRAMSIKDIEHSPHTATMFAAVFPGLGQIYNKKYWKLPIVYGGVAALIYGINFNGKLYKEYSNAYRDFIIRDPNNKSYADIVNNKTTLDIEDVETTYSEWFQRTLKSKKDSYRRYRDMCYFGLVGVYVVQLIDACVDAHFFEFNVDDNISMDWQPVMSNDVSGAYMGASIVITF